MTIYPPPPIKNKYNYRYKLTINFIFKAILRKKKNYYKAALYYSVVTLIMLDVVFYS